MYIICVRPAKYRLISLFLCVYEILQFEISVTKKIRIFIKDIVFITGSLSYKKDCSVKRATSENFNPVVLSL